ncbi:MAG: gamma-glutamyltransferase [Ardenticatenaceae bacterium]|nr:gamma-glutamyltransferase [Ardenticatenaceae bacterium]
MARRLYFHLGRASVAVPGNIAGLCTLASNHGRLPLAALLQPAIEPAGRGYTSRSRPTHVQIAGASLHPYRRRMRAICQRTVAVSSSPANTCNIPHLAGHAAHAGRRRRDYARDGPSGPGHPRRPAGPRRPAHSRRSGLP